MPFHPDRKLIRERFGGLHDRYFDFSCLVETGSPGKKLLELYAQESAYVVKNLVKEFDLIGFSSLNCLVFRCSWLRAGLMTIRYVLCFLQFKFLLNDTIIRLDTNN